MYECITEKQSGKEYELFHHWQELKTFFGYVHAYQCENCGHLISKKQFVNNKYHLYNTVQNL